MQVILMEKVGNLGNLGDVVKVKSGYARNYLLPHGLAYEATPGNLKRIRQERADLIMSVPLVRSILQSHSGRHVRWRKRVSP